MLKSYIRVMKALAEPNRVKIVKMLEKREMCVCEMQAVLKLAQPTVSKHLKILEDADLVVARKEDMWVNYRLGKAAANPYARQMLASLNDWFDDDPEIRLIVDRAATVDRCKIVGKPR